MSKYLSEKEYDVEEIPKKAKSKKVQRIELILNDEHYCYCKNEREAYKEIEDFNMCKPKWYSTDEEYEAALEYRRKAKWEFKTEILEDKANA